MNYVKAGFGVAVGWHLGKFVFEVAEGVMVEYIERYVPERVWNPNHPDYQLRHNRSKKRNHEAKMKIGFSID